MGSAAGARFDGLSVTLGLVAGSANPDLAGRVAGTLGVEPVACEVERFPDGELRPTVGTVRGDDVYIIQPTGRAVNECLVELLLLVDACRRAGALRLTAVVPYFGYARQDRRTRPGQALGARIAANMIAAAGADRLVVVDPHTPTLEAMCPIPVETLSAVSLLAGVLAPAAYGSVIVAPDLGAVKLAERYASRLSLPVAVVRKIRTTGALVRAEELVGAVRNRQPIIVDDMISTGGTVEAAARLLAEHGAAPDLVVVATHGLLIGDAADRLRALPVRRLVVTDTVRPSEQGRPETCSVSGLLAEAIRRLHHAECLDDLGSF